MRLKEHDTKQEAVTAELRERTARMETEILQRSRELHETNRELRDANAAKNEFLSRMSHELRTPLAAISGFSELLTISDLEADKREQAQMIFKASKHLAALVDDVLDLSRIEAGQVSMSAEPVAVEPLAEAAIELMQPLAERHGVVIEPPTFETGSDYAFADNQRLKQVLINLIGNAIKYNREGGRVRIVATKAGSGRIRIDVEDTGRGLDGASIARLFVPFERLDAASTGIEGTGLGLALSRNLVEAMGGTIGVESEPGVGSTFWVELASGEPAAVAPLSEDEEELLAVHEYTGTRRLSTSRTRSRTCASSSRSCAAARASS